MPGRRPYFLFQPRYMDYSYHAARFARQFVELERRRRSSVLHTVRMERHVPYEDGLRDYNNVSYFIQAGTFEYCANADSAETCVICLAEIKNKEELRKIRQCRHKFHKSCIDQWFKRDLNCPICRRSLLGPRLNRTQEYIRRFIEEARAQLSRRNHSSPELETVSTNTNSSVPHEMDVATVAPQIIERQNRYEIEAVSVADETTSGLSVEETLAQITGREVADEGIGLTLMPSTEVVDDPDN